MPFGPVFWPSYALSLLKAELRESGFAAQILYFTIPFAERIGQAFYSDLAGGEKPLTCELAGEWIFAASLFGPRDPETYVEEILRPRSLVSGSEWVKELTPAFIDRIVRARSEVEGFLTACLDTVLETKPSIVGFTSSFQQHVASLALAKRIKQQAPRILTVLGGANCEGVMGAETLRQFPFVDAVVSGEGDRVFPELVRRVLGSKSLTGIAGVRIREEIDSEFASGRFANAPMVRDLDELPYPDYRDFFAQFRASRFHRDWQPSIFFETSRGCWWGERQHCTFCGLNGNGMTYRSKSASRALQEILWLSDQHPENDIDIVDNILDMKYFDRFLPELAERRPNLNLFYETKANLKKEQVRMLARSGVRTIQPGIESLSDPVLAIMRKGVSALQNIQLLKWCKELGVQPSWNLLWGFPDEPKEEYAVMADLVPSLTHLPAPQGIGGLRLDRFSPNFSEARERGLEVLGPVSSYRHVYPFSEEVLGNLAYFFSYQNREPVDVDLWVRPLLERLREWKRVWSESDLFSVEVEGRLLIWDLRPGCRDPLVVLRGLDRSLYRACDEARDAASLARMLATAPKRPPTLEEIETHLGPLVERRLMVSRKSRYLALAIPLGDYTPSPKVAERFFEMVRNIGRSTREGIVISLRPFEPRSSRAVGSVRGLRSKSSSVVAPDRFRVAEQGDLVIGNP
jgi:ribosomal peptide maturation radical SAM protein 1